jgi:hypothetical protein
MVGYLKDIFFFKLALFSNHISQKVYLISYFTKIAICHPLHGRLASSSRLLVGRVGLTTKPTGN